MQKRNPIAKEETGLDRLWAIGDTAGLPHSCCYQDALRSIMLTSGIDPKDKMKAIDAFYDHAYNRGRLQERRDTCGTLNIGWYENSEYNGE